MSVQPTSGVITVNEKKQVIQIHDQYRQRLVFQRVVYLLFVVSAIFDIINLASGYQASIFDWIYIILGLVAIPFLFQLLQTRTAQSEIPFAHLTEISKKTFLGSVVYLHLNNGKVREIHQSLSKQDMDFLGSLVERETALIG